MKFHFRWVTKSCEQKQETGNDFDFISELEVSWKTDFSNIFLFSYKQRTFVLFLGDFINSQLENDRRNQYSYQDLSVHCGDFIKQIKSNLSYTLKVSASKVEVFLLKFDSREAQNSTCHHATILNSSRQPGYQVSLVKPLFVFWLSCNRALIYYFDLIYRCQSFQEEKALAMLSTSPKNSSYIPRNRQVYRFCFSSLHNLAPLHMSLFDRAGLDTEISPHSNFLCKNFDVLTWEGRPAWLSSSWFLSWHPNENFL